MAHAQDERGDIGSSRRRQWIVLGAILILGALLRIWHADFGLPAYYHPDERVASEQVARFLHGDLTLTTYHHPPLIKAVAFFGLSAWRAIHDIPWSKVQDAAHATIRIVSLVFGVLSVLVLYRLCTAFLPVAWALFAALLWAVMPLPVFVSKYGVPDSMLTFFVILTLWLLVRMARTRSMGLYFLSGLCLALGFGSKYQAGLLFVSFVVAHVHASRTTPQFRKALFDAKRLLLFASGAMLGLLPAFFFLLSGGWSDFWQSLLFEKNHIIDYGHHYGSIMTTGSSFYVFHFLRSMLPLDGPLLTLLMAAGAVRLVVRHRAGDQIVLGMLIPYYAAIESVYKVPVNYEHYVLPILPLYVLAAVVLCKSLWDRLSARIRPDAVRAAILSAAGLCLACFPVYKTATMLGDMQPDTRDTARAWIEKHIPEGSTILIPQWDISGYYPDVDRETYRVLLPQRVDIRALRSSPLIDHVLLSSFITDRFLENPDQVPATTQYYREIMEKGKLIFEVKSARGSFLIHNPIIRIYRLDRGSP